MKNKLIELIKKGENEKVEFKEKFDRETIETISAFANTSGGVILIGVTDEGKIKGIGIGKKTLEDIANRIKQNTDPKLYPKTELSEIENKKIILVEVNESKSKPVLAFGRAYRRVGKTNQKLSSEEIRKLARETEKFYFDEQICEEASLADIDGEKVKWFIREAKKQRKLEIQEEVSIKETLMRLNLLKREKLTNAAILLFGKNPQKFFPQAEVKCARFKGIEPLEFIDMKVFRGNIIDQREDALEFVKEHIKLQAKLIGTQRVEKWEYPLEAIREAITNAIVHRDYEIQSNVQIRIFDDKLEVWGVGPLPKPLTVEDLKKKHKSILRNPLIGKSFFLIKFIEEWGTGINRIIKSCLEYGLPEPLFEEISGSLVVTFRKYKISEEIMRELSEEERERIKRRGKDYCGVY